MPKNNSSPPSAANSAEAVFELNADGPRLSVESAVIGAVAGLLAVINGPAPTGHVVVDVILMAVAVAAATSFASVIPPRYAAMIALAAGAATTTWPGLVVGAIAYVAVSGISVTQPPSRRMSALSVALALNLASRSELGWFFGASALIGAGLAAALIIPAIWRRPGRDRRRFAVVVGVVVLVSIVASGFLAIAASQSRDDLRSGEAQVRAGLDQLVEGDVDDARSSFTDARASFDAAHDRLSGRASSISALVPVVAQHRRAGLELTAEARGSSDTLVSQLSAFDLEELTFANGRIDVDAIAALDTPLSQIRTSIVDLRSTVDDIDDPWLVTPVRDLLTELRVEIDDQLERSELFVEVVENAPTMLGRDGRRVYFVAFTTPSEVRGLGGFMGNWAELTIDDGEIELTRFGRSDGLDDGFTPGERTVTGPTDWLTRYGRFGFDSGPNSGVDADAWKNITMSVDMAATGQVIAELYPQSGGRQVDGVFVLDVYAVAALLELTGPIELPGDEGTVTADNAVQFLLKDQYDETDFDERIDVLEIVSNRVFETILEGELPPPLDLLDLLGPLVERGRIAGYAVATDEQALLVRSGLAGTFTDPGTADGIAITYNNAIGNKIDFFLQSSAEYDVVADASTGVTDATLDLQLENQAPRSGEPFYVIGNGIDKPLGSNRTFVSIYSRLPLAQAEIDGQGINTEQATEGGYFVTGVVVELGPGESKTLNMTFSGELDLDDGYELVIRTPPIADSLDMTIDATLATETGERREQLEIGRPGRNVLTIEPFSD